MKTTHTIAAIFGIAFLLYIVAFKVYRMHKHPTWRSIKKELQLVIAEKLIYWALCIMPKGKEKTALAEFIFVSVNTSWNAADKHGREKETECLEKCFGV